MGKRFSHISLIAFFGLTGLAVAEPVRDISVSGNARFEAETAVNYLTFKIGDNPSPKDIDDSVKALLRSGVFSDAEIRSDGLGNYAVRIKENPVVAKVYFEGNDRFDDKTLQEEILIESGGMLTESKIKSSLIRLRDIYKKSGRYAAKIEPFVVEREDNRVDFIFKINEGEIVYIQDITFIGNKRFSDSRLRQVIESKEDAWWRFFTSNTSYDGDRLAVDKSRLTEFYRKNGFADFSVESGTAELNSERDAFILKFSVNEGKRYKINAIRIEDNLTDTPQEELFEYVKQEEDDYFNADKITESEDDLVLFLSERGYPFVDAQGVVTRLQGGDDAKLDITYRISEGPPAYVERIDIKGNSRTVEDVIRRRLFVAEGDPLNRSLLEKSKRQLRGTGFFKELEVLEKEGSQPGYKNLDIKVEEQSTGDITFGAGFSTVDNILGEISLSERNFLGQGQYVRVAALFSGRREEFDFGFTEPYFLGRDLSAGFDLFHITTNFRQEASFDERNSGFVLRSGFRVGEDLTLRPRYKLNSSEITLRNSNVSQIVQDTAGRGNLIGSSVGYELAYDQRDDFLEPTSGYAFSVNQDISGLGGDIKALKSVGTGTLYYTPLEDFTFSWQFEGGSVFAFGGYDLRILDRYFIGGNSFRGFEVAGIGPRFIPNDPTQFNDDPIGGAYYGVLRSELAVPLPGLDDFGMAGAFFNDIGSLWGVQNTPNVGTEGRIEKDTALRASAGFGLKWRSPMGPIRLDFSVPFLKKRYDRTQVFQFNAGSSF